MHMLKRPRAQNLKCKLNEFVCYLNYAMETKTLTSCYSTYLVCLPTAIIYCNNMVYMTAQSLSGFTVKHAQGVK